MLYGFLPLLSTDCPLGDADQMAASLWMRSLRNALVPRASSVAVKAVQGRRPFFNTKPSLSDSLSVVSFPTA